MLFIYFLKRLIHKGALTLISSDGNVFVIGDGTPSKVVIKLHRKKLEFTLGLRPDLKIGEAYMNGDLTIEHGSLSDLISLLFINYRDVEKQPFFRMIEKISGRLSRLGQYNPLSRAKHNVAKHYDLPDDLYRMFLDEDRQYSCAYFTHSDNSLEQAQLDKKRHIASKLFLNKPYLKVLDIGSGWGGLGLYLSHINDCDVTGITLSEKQLEVSNRRVWKTGRGAHCHFKLQDYRLEQGSYDRIVSVGMFEHVGKKHYHEFFAQIRRLLSYNGVCLLHTIARFDEPAQVNAFIRKHIFPGTDVPALSEIMESVQQSKLFVTDIEILRLHYAETLKHWVERYYQHKNEVIARYGIIFYRKWEFYLISCEMGFRYQHLMVAQIQLTREVDALPITRNYMFDWENANSALDQQVDQRKSASSQ